MRTNEKGILVKGAIVTAVVTLAALGARAAKPVPPTWLGAMAAAEQEAPDADEAAEAAPSKPIPLDIGVEYTLVSDYVWRGMNFSEYAGERGERCNNQMNVSASYDTGTCGSINASIWFEWFSGQKAMDPASDGYLQEVDYTLSWSYDIEPCGLGVEAGVIFYHFPQSEGDAANTLEWFVGLSFDDSKLFGTEEPVLNPTVTYYYDVDLVKGGQWLEFGISHDFALADLGCDVPIVKDLTITPSATLGLSHRYWTESTKLGNLLLGLSASYDLGKAIGMDPKCGSLSLTGFLNYSQALGIEDDVPGYNDEFFGGVTIGYGW